MALTWWWLGLLVLLATLAVAGVAWWRAGQERPDEVVLAAHTSRLTRLPAYRTALTSLRRHLAALGVVLLLALVPAAWAASRPADVHLVEPEKRNRDIMLCLDVSGSMYATDQAILRSFVDIVSGFEGERIGLVLFDAQSVLAFPLTDDYDLVTEQLEGYAAGFELGGGDGINPQAGTWNPDLEASSLIPDGLASCTQAFDHADVRRPRAIVLGTDNLVSGRGVYTLAEATTQAEELGVRVYALDPNEDGAAHEELAAATERTGGRTYGLSDEGAVSGIAQEIERVEADRLPDARPQLVRTDQPRWPVLLLTLALLGYLPLAWWWRR